MSKHEAIVIDTSTNQHRPVDAADQFDTNTEKLIAGAVVAGAISGDAGNQIVVGSDGKLKVPATTFISADAGNDIVLGSDQRPYLAETVTKLEYDGGTVLTYTAEDGGVTTHDLASMVTAFGAAAPQMDGAANAGLSVVASREDHVHPTDTTRAPLASPAFTGTPTAPTAAGGTNTTQVATTAFVQAAVSPKANLASPTFTGTPAAPTAAAGTNTTQLATTAFVQAGLAGKADTAHAHAIADVTGLQGALDAKAPLASPALTGTPTAPTAAPGVTTQQIANMAALAAAISALKAELMGGVPSAALDTLVEIGTRLLDDESVVAALTTTLAGKLSKSANLSDLPDPAAARTALQLSAVAHSNSYTDLADKPTIPPAYSLPVATATVLGGVKQGVGLAIDSAGVASLTNAAALPTNRLLYWDGAKLVATNHYYDPVTGFEGIGTTGPGAPLHIKTGADPGILIETTSNSPGLRFKDYASTPNQWEIGSGWSAGNTGEFFIWDPVHAAGAPRMVISTAGNVGIGTAGPTSKLHVDGTGTLLQLTSSGFGSLYAGTDVNHPWFGTPANHDIRLVTNATEKMRISAGGNIGIGTPTPTRGVLEVAGVVGATTAVFGTGNKGVSLITNWPGVYWNSYNMSGVKAMSSGYSANFSQNPTTGAMTLGISAAAATAADEASTHATLMTILPNGNVGIRLTDPRWGVESNDSIGTRAVTFATLPSAARGDNQWHAIVDAPAAYSSALIGQAAAGGGSNLAPVHSRGGTWHFG